jgi:hypothetical protein
VEPCGRRAFRNGSIVTYACNAVVGLDRSAWVYYVHGLPYQDTCPWGH